MSNIKYCGTLCSVNGCDKPAYANNWCTVHYQRHRYSGTTDPVPERFVWLLSHNGYACFSFKKKQIYIHQAIAEKALGKPLPKAAVVHHVNNDRSDNRNENLVICNDRSYHKLIHQRTDSVNAGYPANYRRCWLCGGYSDPETMKRVDRAFIHKDCSKKYSLELRNRRNVTLPKKEQQHGR